MTRRTLTLLIGGALLLGGGYFLSRRGPPARVPSEPFVIWARTRAIPLQSAEPGRGVEDLQAIRHWVGRARVVGVGEATHGTREFFQLKHRLLEFFVQEMGFTAFAMETGFAEAIRVNDYVLGGGGDALSVVQGMRYWIWNTEEVVALVEWMRRYNQRPTTTSKVRFYGFDLQSVAAPVAHVREYLRASGLPEAQVVAAGPNRAKEWGLRGAEARAGREAGSAEVRRWGQFLEAHRSRLIAGGDERAWRTAQRAAQVALQAIAFAGLDEVDIDKFRDAAMADNVKWLRALEGSAGKLMLWAHNGHVAATSGNFSPMGQHLRGALGPDYFVLGTAFNQGAFRSKPGPREYVFGPARPESFDGVLARVGPPIFALNLRDPSMSADAARWLAGEHAARKAGTMYLPPEDDDNNWLRIVPRDCFDAVIFFDRTTAVRAHAPAK